MAEIKEMYKKVVKDKFPDQHVERDTIFKVPLNETQFADAEAAIEKAMNRGCVSRSEAVWMIFVDYLSAEEVPNMEEIDCKGAIQ